ncbi:hypothetical protein [Streptomyces sp. NPDC127119]|uniref:hypothetical protein n=1 Tax=Streptomyces sp. NPDC127119 TaxID=3345370 RepID=UPI003636E5D1
MSRESHIARTFIELADTLVEDFDVIDFLQQMTVRCSELLDVTAAAVFLDHPCTSRMYSSVQADVCLTEAAARVRAHAYRTELPLLTTADEVARRLYFRDGQDGTVTPSTGRG